MTEDLFAFAMIRLKQGDFAGAGGLLRASVDRNPEHAPSWSNLGIVEGAQRHHEAALTLARIAASLEPENANYASNVAKALWCLERYDDAMVWVKIALSLNPDHLHAWHNHGSIHYAQGRPHVALSSYDKVLRIDPDREDTKWDRAWALLACGQYAEGLAAYELRWNRLVKGPIWDSGISEWKGEDLSSKTIVVHHEQGYGDTLNFVRFAMQLKSRYEGATVILAVPPALWRLFQDAEGIDDILIVESGPAKFAADFHSPVISVMRWLWPHWSIAGEPYLKAPAPPVWLDNQDGRFHVGLIWSAAVTGLPTSEIKSIDPTLYAPLAEIPGVVLHGLQKNDGVDELDWTGMGSLIRDHSRQIKDFYDLAGVMAGMDLVVSVDTGPLHLAGAIGVPCIGMLPYARCWFWPMDDGAKVTPLYNSMHVESQTSPRDWKGVIERVSEIVRQRADERRQTVRVRHLPHLGAFA